MVTTIAIPKVHVEISRGETIPTVAGQLTRGETCWQLVIDRCPHCGRKHVHGGGPIGERPYGGHRVSHRLNKGRNPGYTILIDREAMQP